MLKAAKVLRDEYKLLASAAPTTPRPAAATRTAAPTPAKNASISTTTTSKATRNDATTPPLPPIVTLEAVDERIQSAIRPLQTDIDTLKASLAAAAATPPTPPTTPPQPTEDAYDTGNRSFAEVLPRPHRTIPAASQSAGGGEEGEGVADARRSDGNARTTRQLRLSPSSFSFTPLSPPKPQQSASNLITAPPTHYTTGRHRFDPPRPRRASSSSFIQIKIKNHPFSLVLGSFRFLSLSPDSTHTPLPA